MAIEIQNTSEPIKSTPEQNELKLNPEWAQALALEFGKDYMKNLKDFLRSEYAKGKTIYPKGGEYFAALNSTPLSKVKAVIIGQDPYHGPGQAHGLCFSVQPGVAPPPSLVNVFKELESDLKVTAPRSGYLAKWADQGVLLINSVLTVEAGQAASHRGRGWEIFTDKIVEVLNQQPQPIVFILWGAYAQKKAAHIDTKKHAVLKAPHPSPLSAHRGFLGSRPFSKTNTFLQQKGREPIDWSL